MPQSDGSDSVADADPAKRPSSTFLVRVGLAAVLAIGAALRFIGLRFGFPFLVHADEWAIVDNAVDLARRHSFEPSFIDRPDHFEIKLNYLVDALYSRFRYGEPLDVAFANHPLDFYLLGRGISAVFGVACIGLAFLIVKRFNPVAGLIAAGLVALFAPMVQNSQYATPEMPQAFFTLLLIWLCIRYLEKPTAVLAALAGASVGAAVTIKYPAVITAVMVAAVVSVAATRLRSWKVFFGHGTAALASLFGAIVVISPVLLTDFGRVRRMILQQGNPVHLGADGLGWAGNVAFYATAFSTTAGVLLTMAALGGAIWCLRRRPVETLPLWTGAIYWLALSAVALHWPRWGIPMYLTPLLFAAIGIQVLFAWAWPLRPRGSKAAQIGLRFLLVGAAGLLGLNQLISAMLATASAVATDSRVEGARFAETIGATKENSIFEGYTPLQPGAPGPVFRYFAVQDGRLHLSSKAPEPTKFVILSSGMRSRYFAESKYATEQQTYRMIDKQLPLLRSISPVKVKVSILESVNIGLQSSALWDFARGGFAGPQLTFYDAASLTRVGQR